MWGDAVVEDAAEEEENNKPTRELSLPGRPDDLDCSGLSSWPFAAAEPTSPRLTRTSSQVVSHCSCSSVGAPSPCRSDRTGKESFVFESSASGSCPKSTPTCAHTRASHSAASAAVLSRISTSLAFSSAVLVGFTSAGGTFVGVEVPELEGDGSFEVIADLVATRSNRPRSACSVAAVCLSSKSASWARLCRSQSRRTFGGDRDDQSEFRRPSVDLGLELRPFHRHASSTLGYLVEAELSSAVVLAYESEVQDLRFEAADVQEQRACSPGKAADGGQRGRRRAQKQLLPYRAGE